MRRLSIALFIVACGTPEPAAVPVPPGPPVGPVDKTVATSGPGAHAATPHRHSATHGGEVKELGAFQVEGRFLKSGLLVWVNDATHTPIDLATVEGTAVLEGPAGVTTVMLVSMGDHLHAPMTLPEGVAADAVVTLKIAGRPVSVDFRTGAVGSLAAHDHTSLHGGVVSMWKDHHVEYVAAPDRVRFYVTDGKRVPVNERVSGTVTIGGIVTPLAFDPATGALSAEVTPAGMVMLAASVGEETFELGFGG
ncbi:MAG: hypothetical protein Q8P18_33070 [Pseudomonadota bacterium]|nr:hypothetical protein [Pseudomonadota bacterium]